MRSCGEEVIAKSTTITTCVLRLRFRASPDRMRRQPLLPCPPHQEAYLAEHPDQPIQFIGYALWMSRGASTGHGPAATSMPFPSTGVTRIDGASRVSRQIAEDYKRICRSYAIETSPWHEDDSVYR